MGIEIALQTLLEYEKGFESFMGWLPKEWSTECLLFIIETVQFQNFLIEKCQSEQHKSERASPELEKYKLERAINNLDLDLDISFPSSCPKSFIVYNKDTNVYQKAILLYNKYIANDAVFLINIPHTMQKKIHQTLFVTEEDSDIRVTHRSLVRLFSRSQREVWTVMKGSFQRYQKTAAYESFIEKHRRSVLKKINLVSTHIDKSHY